MEAQKEKVVALVKCLSGQQHPDVIFQATLDPERVFKSYIRFGFWGDNKGQGDELTGWMRLEDWEVVDVLGDVLEDGKTIKFRL